MNAKTRAHDLGKSGGGGKRKAAFLSPVSSCFIFVFALSQRRAPTISEQATNEIKHFIPKIKIKRQESKMKSLSL